jgi:hypothetical protein
MSELCLPLAVVLLMAMAATMIRQWSTSNNNINCQQWFASSIYLDSLRNPLTF